MLSPPHVMRCSVKIAGKSAGVLQQAVVNVLVSVSLPSQTNSVTNV